MMAAWQRKLYAFYVQSHDILPYNNQTDTISPRTLVYWSNEILPYLTILNYLFFPFVNRFHKFYY